MTTFHVRKVNISNHHVFELSLKMDTQSPLDAKPDFPRFTSKCLAFSFVVANEMVACKVWMLFEERRLHFLNSSQNSGWTHEIVQNM